MKIENVPISKIRPYPNNPRRNDKAVASVARSIQEYGFNVPIVLDAQSVIVSGHTRYKAAIQLGMATVPCVRPDLTPEQARKFRIVDNKVSELADWDMTLLMREIGDMDAAHSMQPFFNDVDLEAELAKLANPPPSTPVASHTRTTGGKPVTCPACRHQFVPSKKSDTITN